MTRRSRTRPGRGLALAVVLLGMAASLAAQQLPSLPSSRRIQLTGEISGIGELYSNSSPLNRRPGEVGRLYANLNASLFGSVNVGINLLLTSEDGTSAGYGGLPGRQRIGEIGIHPQWSWGRAHLGTFTDGYSPLTYSGVRVTGAGFDINPGLLRLAAFGGRSRSAVDGGIVNGTYQRSTYGGKIGVGRKSLWQPGTYFDVVVVRTWDDPSSLPVPVDTTLPPNSPGAVVQNPFAVTPQENLVASAIAGLTFLERKISWRSEFAISGHTLDRRATPLDPSATDQYPAVFRSLMEPRVGSHVDNAFTTDVQFRLPRLPGATPRSPRSLTATLGYRYVGPGYVSLGSASLLNDVREYRVRASTRFRRWSLQLDGYRQSDNLLGQKLSTTTRYRGGAVFNLQATRQWNMTFRGNHLSMGNGSSDSLRLMDYTTTTLGTTQTLVLGPRQPVENLSLDYTYQKAGDANPLRASSEFLSNSVDLRASIRLRSNIRLSPTAGLTSFRVGTEDSQLRAIFGAVGVWSPFRGRLTTTGSLSNSRYGGRNTLSGTLSGRFQVTPQDEVSLMMKTSRFADRVVSTSYNETLFSLRWTRSFRGGL